MDSATENAAAAPASTPGAILAAERERQGLARADIAQRLHMSVSQIEALEAGDYARLPRGTFLRGFARNYARALGLDPEPVVGLLAQDAPRENAPRIVVPSQNIRFDPLGQRLANPYVKVAGIAVALLVLGFAAMYWWLFIRPQGVQSTVVKKPAVEASRPAPAPIPEPAPAEPPKDPPVPVEATAKGGEAPAVPAPAPAPESPAAATAPTTAAPATTAVPPPASAPAAEATRAPAPGEGLIRLTFRAAAWVEITDNRGKVLLSRTHPGGSSAEVVGRPPFNLVIGNAPEVRLTYNGREVDLAPHTRVAVARFSLP
ncbi:MAG: helix-turn-helix domain-containing protein [Burkholderiales bacterium]|nr:helix-turn-helix domain-containing protein [Burkholderiales bacterium]